MQRLVYRNFGDHESIVALHSINTKAKAGGVRWYEFRLDKNRNPYLYQQSTYAPDGFYRWMGSMAMDRLGNIGIGYSFGGTPTYAGQRFAARLAGDPLGQLTFHETVLVEGGASQTNTLRWEDYVTTAMDPSDDCTFWYVGDYLQTGAPSYTTRIGAFRLPGCLTAKVTGAVYFDLNHNGRRNAGEPGLAGRGISYQGSKSGKLITDGEGNFSAVVPADPIYADPSYLFAEQQSRSSSWIETGQHSATVHLNETRDVADVTFGEVCTVRNTGAKDLHFWSGGGKAVLKAHEQQWRSIAGSNLYLVNDDGSHFALSDSEGPAYDQLRKWLRRNSSHNPSYSVSKQLAVTAFNIAFEREDGNATVNDPVAGDWLAIHAFIDRVNAFLSGHPDTSSAGAEKDDALKYQALLEHLNRNVATVTPSSPAGCKAAF